MARETLFREEAVEHQRDRAYGEVTLVHPFKFSIITAIALLLAASVIAFGFWGEYTRKARVTGYLSPTQGLIKIHTPEVGTLIDKRVTEGQHVARGDALFVLSTERTSASSTQAMAAAMTEVQSRRASLKQDLNKQANIAAIEQRSLLDRANGLENELHQLRAEIATQQERVASAERLAARYRTLVEQKFVSEAQVQEKTDALLDQRGRLQGLQRSRLSLEKDLAQLRSEYSASALKAKSQQSATEREISKLDQDLTEHDSRRQIIITAPSGGVVTSVLAERGQTATPNTPLLTILPEGTQLEAHLLIPSRSIGFIGTDQKVALRYAAFPHEKFGMQRGHIVEVSQTLISPGETNLPVKLEESMYRVRVTLDSQTILAYGKKLPLQAGMQLDADIWLDRRRVIDWILDPVFAVAGRV